MAIPLLPPHGQSASPSTAGPNRATRRFALALLAAAAIASGCAAPPSAVGTAGPASIPGVAGTARMAGTTDAAATAAAPVLAPGGRLRVGVYPGSPTSLVRGADGQLRGVTVELGRTLAQRLGVVFELVEFPRIAAVVDALQVGQVDFTVTNASPARAAVVDFSTTLVDIELGYLVLPGSPVQSVDEVDRPGRRIGVSQGSSSLAALTRQFQAATLLTAPSLQAASELLARRQVDAFASNKAILFELADGLPGARVLPGRWGLEHLAIAVPKGRDAALPFVRVFAVEARASGLVQRAADRAGLRGTAAPGH